MPNPLPILRERAQWYADGCPNIDEGRQHYLLNDLPGDAGADLQAALALIDVLLPALKDVTAELRAIHRYFYLDDAPPHKFENIMAAQRHRNRERGYHFDSNGYRAHCPGGCPAETYCDAADAAIAKAEGQ